MILEKEEKANMFVHGLNAACNYIKSFLYEGVSLV